MKRIANTELDVFPLCLGGNVFGWTADREQSFAVLDAFAAAGGNFFDTSDVYWKFSPGNKGGESETIIGEWMHTRGCRDRMVVSTKIGAADGMTGGLSAQRIRRNTEASMRRLQVDVIDLLYAHVDDTETPLTETLGAFDELVRAGKVRYIGASRYPTERLAQALEISDREGFTRYVATQPLYSLVERGYEQDVAPLLERTGLASMPYYSLAAGFLTGKYRPGVEVSSARAHGPRPGGAMSYLDARGVRVLDALDEVSAAHTTTVAAVALAWLMAQPTVTAPIASARNVAQLQGILPAAELTLSEQELQLLSAASAQ
ncbi:aldo/keto reductase [Streptomyces sp. NPDC004629]|uniref:aldo/keto reductase n=1 Tax=Streptomyces sp. NPDC004629 TaxID=3364705 RepID=UPI0036BEEA6F